MDEIDTKKLIDFWEDIMNTEWRAMEKLVTWYDLACGVYRKFGSKSLYHSENNLDTQKQMRTLQVIHCFQLLKT